MTFADRSKDRNNHFNLIRLIAALAVLVGHGAMLLGIQPIWEPGFYGYDLSTAGISVDAFFVISGFLVTASLLNRRDLTGFVWARFLRIFPGLWVMLLLTVFGLGLAMTTLPAGEYLAAPAMHRYFWRCATIVNGVQQYLPGVFATNVADHAFNASLWTLPLEWRMYEFLALLWAVFVFAPRYRRIVFRVLAPVAAIATLIYVAADEMRNLHANIGTMHAYMFVAGSAIFVLGDRIRVSSKAVPVLLGVLLLSIVDRQLTFVTYLIAMPFLILNLAYLPGRAALRFNAFGDYSYGVYIYAFPIQQTLIALEPEIALSKLTFVAVALTSGMAAFSWHFVEKPALAHKESATAATMRLFKAIRARTTPMVGA